MGSMSIGVIVYGATETEAKQQVINLMLNRLVEPTDYDGYGKYPFDGDWYPRRITKFINQPDVHPFGFGRYPKYGYIDLNQERIVEVYPVETIVGRFIIRTLMRTTKLYFRRNMNRLRKELSIHSDEDIWSRRFRPDTDVRNLMHSISASEGCYVFLYDNDGCGILAPDHLQEVLEKWEHSWDKMNMNEPWPYADSKVYVSVLRVHD